MYILKALRHSQIKYETDVILDMEIDPVRYSLDFHNQEARCQVKLCMMLIWSSYWRDLRGR